MSELIYPGSLHNHTQYSNARLRDCIIKENDLIDYAIELGHTTVAITDHESVMNAVKVNKYANKIKEKYPNFKVILGNEIYLCRNGLNNSNFNRETDKYYHFILLAKDLEGHRQIREISTRAWRRSYMSRGMRRVPTYYQDLFDIIGANPGHVIGSTACLGSAIGTQILRGTSSDKLKIWIQQLDGLFGHGNFYLEMQPSRNKEQVLVNKRLLEFSKELDMPYIITTDSHYLKKEDRTIHKAYLNAQNGDREVDDFYSTTYMMGTDELLSYFDYLSEDEIRIAFGNIQHIADKCEDYSLLKPLKIPELTWRPHRERDYDLESWFNLVPSLAKFNNSPYTSDNYLVKSIIDGINAHDDLQSEKAYAEINACLEDTWVSSEVNKARWSAYFLNLQKIIDTCWEAGTLIGPSRGSGGGFILLYLLNITQINPLRETTEVFRWRFLNPERASVLDIDTDIEGGRREQVLQHLRKTYGDDRVANVATFRTEKSKSAILTAARGLGIDVDIAQYVSSLIPADRGQLRSLSQCMYGDEDKGFAPIKQFVYEMTENYPELWEVASKIEGLVCGTGVHAGGVIFVDEPFTNSTALMRAPDGTICTQFELHDSEDVSLIKMDLLSVEALDKIHNCLDLLGEYGYIETKPTLRETYEDVIGIYNLERDDPNMWKMVWNHEINSLFQMEKQSGINGIALSHPKTVGELAVLNSVIRLMASEKGAEQPLDMWTRYRKNINQWIQEMRDYGLTQEQIDWLSSNSAITDGICESQEGLMSLVQDERVGGNTLTFADKCRKAIAKKQGKLFEECEQFYFDNAAAKGCDMKLAHYVWDVVFKPQRGYSFCRAHTLAYSLIALQEMNLAYKFPLMFWNCACLISDAGGNDSEDEELDEIIEYKEEENYSNEMEEFNEDEDEAVESYTEDEDCDGYPAEVIKTATGKKKKKVKATNYGRIASAIGRIASTGVRVSSPDINESNYTFSPDVEHNTIRYGLSGITRIGEDLVKTIMANRPYCGIDDFISKVKVNKPQMVNLIKAGAFDSFGDRATLMHEYIDSIADKKKRITLQNMQMLIEKDMIPEQYKWEISVFNFNKYLKKHKSGAYYELDDIAFNFYEPHFDLDLVFIENNTRYILQSSWDSIYKKSMDTVRSYLKSNNSTILNDLNTRLFQETWDKYCGGSISKWEMDSISFYNHEHELSSINNAAYNFANFNRLPEEPIIDKVLSFGGKQIPVYKTYRFAGTVLDKDKNKGIVTLLTTDGVVQIRIFKAQFAEYDKQLSQKQPDGTKKVIEKSWFSRGNKIIVNGFRRGNDIVLKKYKSTPYSIISLITKINDDGTLEYKNEREEV